MKSVPPWVGAGESEHAAFKGPRAPLETVARSVCALLNQQGGAVLWGVDERGRVCGVGDAEERARALNDYLMGHLTPRPLVSVSTEAWQGKQVVVVDVPRGADKPYALARTIWVRLGRQDLRASADDSARMVEASAVLAGRWEREPVPGFGLGDCDGDELAETRRELVLTGRLGITVPGEPGELMRRLYLARNGQLTNAAMVLFAREPAAWSPGVGLRIVTYPSGKQGASFQEQWLHGPAVRVLRQAVGILQQQTGFSGRFRPGRIEREDRPAYPLFALREGLVNALVHRDYEGVRGQLRVEVYPERLVIQNPGQLPEGWTERDIPVRAESRPANPDIARVFYVRGLMERLGMGGRRLVEACLASKARRPVWEAEGGTVSLTLFRAPCPPTVHHAMPRQQGFFESIPPGESFKAADYARAVAVSLRQARRDLAGLAEMGLLQRHGKGPATAYRPAGKAGHA